MQGPSPYLLHPASHRETGPSVGLGEDQGKGLPFPWLLEPLGCWLTAEKGKRRQRPRAVVFWEATREGNWDTCWVVGAKKHRQPAQPCHSPTGTLGQLLPLWATLSPSLGQGLNGPLVGAGTSVSPSGGHKGSAELPEGHIQHSVACRGTPTLGGAGGDVGRGPVGRAVLPGGMGP